MLKQVIKGKIFRIIRENPNLRNLIGDEAREYNTRKTKMTSREDLCICPIPT